MEPPDPQFLPSDAHLEAAQTRERLLDAAEELFADADFEAVSLRDITGQAQANIAAVNYHFGSKEGLFRQTLARRLKPHNAGRIRRLRALVEAAETPSLPAVIEAFMAPIIEDRLLETAWGPRFMRLLARMMSDPSGRFVPYFAEELEEARHTFKQALCRAAPQLTAETSEWAQMCVVGIMLHFLGKQHIIPLMTKGVCKFDAHALETLIVPFCVAGVEAIAQAERSKGETEGHR